MSNIDQISQVDLAVSSRDVFLRVLVRNLAGVLENVVGLEDAEGFISIVGENLGRTLNDEYINALEVGRLSKPEIAATLVDLKRRIEGDFYIIEQDEEKIVLGNRRCPFGDMVLERPSMCMMTSNVFGKIAAENTGYARVELHETIANHDRECRVTVYFTPMSESSIPAREYFRSME